MTIVNEHSLKFNPSKFLAAHSSVIFMWIDAILIACCIGPIKRTSHQWKESERDFRSNASASVCSSLPWGVRWLSMILLSYPMIYIGVLENQIIHLFVNYI